ncbi:DUF1707 and DUF4190 domain-containing protein [Streptomyces sp. NPDC126514]|uniref:DUF1707 and DUF4190 domain-containing protein n=1 Tax=Streptomyces sp. NPDC126514 TaxID=3155210 RepID=UPI003334221A
MTQPVWPSWQGGGSVMLASHADRERAVDVLKAGYGEGRLEQPEFEKRVARAYAARTVGELGLLVADLPSGPLPAPAAFLAVPHPAPYCAVPHAAPYYAVPRPRMNGKAVGAAVCGLLCLVSLGFTGIPAVVLGHSARAEIRRTGEAGDALALTGLVLGWMSTAGWALVLALMMVAAAASGA